MINLEESFDKEYYDGMKVYLDKAWSKYNNINLEDKKKALKDIKETDGSFDEKDTLGIIAFVVGMFKKGTIEQIIKLVKQVWVPTKTVEHNEIPKEKYFHSSIQIT